MRFRTSSDWCRPVSYTHLYYIETPKTKNGKRELPLTERAYQAIQRILNNRGKSQPLIVGGYSNFLFLNREGLPKVAGNYEGMVRGLIKKRCV